MELTRGHLVRVSAHNYMIVVSVTFLGIPAVHHRLEQTECAGRLPSLEITLNHLVPNPELNRELSLDLHHQSACTEISELFKDLLGPRKITCVDVGGQEVIEHEICRRRSRPGLKLRIYADGSVNVGVGCTSAEETVVNVDREIRSQRFRGCGRVGRRQRHGGTSGIKDAHGSGEIVLCEERHLVRLVDVGFLACNVVEVPDGSQVASLGTVREHLERPLDFAVPVCEPYNCVDECTEVGRYAALEEGIVELCDEGGAGCRSEGNEGAEGMVEVKDGRLGVRQRRFLGGVNQPADVLQDGRRVLGVFEGEGKRGPRGDGTWFLVGGDLGLVVFVGGGGVSFA
jgi:hypothetical protein